MRRLPIGNDEFREIQEKDYYYIDKTMLISDFLVAGDKVTLIARPRRFGKNLGATMLREFFDINVDMDAKENAYHMLFLGMYMTLRGSYLVSSNLETGTGRSDITLKSLKKALPNVIVEFKQGSSIEELKEIALQQIVEQKYYAGLEGEVLCIGLAHDKKRCAVSYKILN